jgi:hypothetical protein
VGFINHGIGIGGAACCRIRFEQQGSFSLNHQVDKIETSLRCDRRSDLFTKC